MWWTWMLAGCGPELPEGWEGAERVAALTQAECAGNPYEDYDERIDSDLSGDPLRVDYSEAHFRCAQDVEGFWKRDGDRFDVLVQPIDMHPSEVAGCDCLYDIAIDVTTTEDVVSTVSLYRRWDALNEPNDPVLIGVVDRSAACGTLDPTACASRTDCAAITARPMQDDGAGGQCVDSGLDKEPVGCKEADLDCIDVETVATDPDGASWWFSSGCLPDGWSATDDTADEC